MTEKELKRLSRKDLLELIYTMKQNELELQRRLEQADQYLADRTIHVTNAGSIAEAALSITGVFQAAQESAEIYLRSVQRAAADADKLREDARVQSEKLLADAHQLAQARTQETEAQCQEMLAQAQAQVQEKWDAFQKNVQEALRTHAEIFGYLQEEKKNQ